jgi:hypothetical protein
MLRATLALLLLAASALAFAPSAEAGTAVCPTIVHSPLYDMTYGTACFPPYCYYNTAPNAWTGCTTDSADRALDQALCFYYTAPATWVPDCT